MRMTDRQRRKGKEKGVLLPVFSLPSPHGIGCFSREAYEFVDWLKDTGHAFWQILPLNPTGNGDSPYQALSCFAGDAYFIDPEQLIRDGLLKREEVEDYDRALAAAGTVGTAGEGEVALAEDNDGDTGAKAIPAEGGTGSAPARDGAAQVNYEALYGRRLDLLRIAQRRFAEQGGKAGADYSGQQAAESGTNGADGDAGADLSPGGKGGADHSPGGAAGSWERFCRDNAFWLEDYALFMALRERFGREESWEDWPEELRHREPGALREAAEACREDVDFYRWTQYEFDRQWTALKTYANEAGVRIIGDMPVYVSYDSADCWADPGQFLLDGDLKPSLISGVPPDAFTPEGQLWGNPLYDWDRMKAEGYPWWISRARQAFRMYDMIRLDHFRGYEAYYTVAADAENAIHGEWRPGPGMDLFQALAESLGEKPAGGECAAAPADAEQSIAAPADAKQSIAAPADAEQSIAAPADVERSIAAPADAKQSIAAPADVERSIAAPADAAADLRGRFIAEDLGFLTDGVRKLLADSGFPGTKVLQFAFDGDPGNPYLTENYPENCVAYTGTHDNDTTAGWFRSLHPDAQKGVLMYLDAAEAWNGEADRSGFEGGDQPGSADRNGDPALTAADLMIERLMASPADLVIIPMQDYLGLGSEARTNIPGTAQGNWRWRLRPEELAALRRAVPRNR